MFYKSIKHSKSMEVNKKNTTSHTKPLNEEQSEEEICQLQGDKAQQ